MKYSSTLLLFLNYVTVDQIIDESILCVLGMTMVEFRCFNANRDSSAYHVY